MIQDTPAGSTGPRIGKTVSALFGRQINPDRKTDIQKEIQKDMRKRIQKDIQKDIQKRIQF